MVIFIGYTIKSENMNESEIKSTVKKEYGKIASQYGRSSERNNCRQRSMNSCCGNSTGKKRMSCTRSSDEHCRSIGYSESELESIPEQSNGGLGCGNPIALASLKKGDIVLDLGSGMGIDCFLAAKRVGKEGKVIGIDMTPEMVEKSRELAQKERYTNVEFKQGEIEALPLADNSVDVIISNCVINLVPNKEKAFQEAFRVLKPGGRMILSDIVLVKDLPDSVKDSVEAYTGCVAGAIDKEKYLELMKNSGFINMKIHREHTFFQNENTSVLKGSREDSLSPEDVRALFTSAVSMNISMEKPYT